MRVDAAERALSGGLLVPITGFRLSNNRRKRSYMIVLVKDLFHSLVSMRFLSISAVLALCFFFSAVSSQSQAQPVAGEGPRWYGTTGKSTPYDTAALKEAQERTLESSGLLEGPIDPGTYLIGPNDFLTVTIWTQKTLQFETLVTPDAKLLIPSVGSVDVRGLTLDETREKVQQAVSKEYRVKSDVSLLKMREFKVSVIGAVHQTGSVVATPATRVSEAIDMVGGALQRADKRNVVLYRRLADGTNIELQVDLLAYYATGNREANPTLLDGDVIRVNILDPSNIVVVSGRVKAEGEYTWNPNDSISSLIRASFGLTADANPDSIEVVSVNNEGQIVSRTWHRMLPDGSVTNDRTLDVGDRIYVRPIPKFRERSQVVVAGEMKKPGFYPIVPGETRLLDVINAAGGFTLDASIADAGLTRRQAEGQDDEYFAYVNAIESERRTPEESEYFRTKLLENRKQGYMPIDFRALISGDPNQNVLLIDDDSLYVPKKINYIRISGKVKNPGNFLYDANYDYLDYIAQAGGYGWRAEVSETQVIKGRTGDRLPAEDTEEYALEPGDAIFVPEEKEGSFWEGFTTAITIVAQLATIVAVVVSIVPNN